MFKNRLMQLFKDNAGSNIRDFRMETLSESDVEIYLYGVIGDMYGGISDIDFVKMLKSVPDKTENVHLRMNSPGGDVFAARTMVTHIRQSDKNIIGHIDGECASACSYVATACDSLEIVKGGFIMIHEAWTLDMGNKRDFRKSADLLEQIDNSIADDITGKTGIEKDEVLSMMEAESWINADLALEKKFVDSIFDGKRVKGTWNLSAYSNVPDEINQRKTEEPEGYDRERFERRLSLINAVA